MSLQKGNDGVAVSNLQKNLTQIGVTELEADGVFGEKTFMAVEAFQSAHSLPVDGVVDENVQDTITKCLVGQLNLPAHGPNPWMPWMNSHIGEKEQTGAPASEFDKEVFSHTSYENLDGIMEPGCAATACAALEESGYASPHDATAESFRKFGVDSQLLPGAIVGFNWAGVKGKHADHVAFFDHAVGDKHIACLGGNQGHEVKVSIFSRDAIDFVRWPIEALQVKAGELSVAEAAPLASDVAETLASIDESLPIKVRKSKKETT